MRSWFFRENSYPLIIDRLIAQSPAPRGMISKVAEAIGCQRSYLSQVLHGKAHLTKDQAWNLGRFFDFSGEEARYFEYLVDHDRAASPAYRQHLQKELAALRREGGKISKQFAEAKEFSETEALTYFHSWLPIAVHVCTSIPEFQEPARMAKRLGVRLPEVLRVLHALEKKGMVKLVKQRWEFVKGPGYLPKESALVSLHHQNWRDRAVDDSKNPQSAGLHYAMVQALSREDFERLKALVLEFIAKTQEISVPSDSEMLTVLNLDFFEP